MAVISEIIKKYRPDLKPYEELYKHFHARPELSFQEKETAADVARELSKLNSYEVFTGIGGHGIAAVLKNGPGKTVLLRADMDGLPVEEKTDLPYASKHCMKDLEGIEKATMHACGHDMHITALLAAAEALAKAKDQWTGTLLLIFQPAEEKAGGAQAMVDGGLYKKVPEPDLAIGGHVIATRAGTISTRRGLMASAADSFHVTIHGRASHASMPNLSIDPIVQSASTILRLQTIVSRELNAADYGVVTVSAIHAGDAENIIPASAELKLNVRSTSPGTREHILNSIRRIVEAEARASGATEMPVVKETTKFPFLYNDADVTGTIEHVFEAHFPTGPHGYDKDCPRLPGSEDFGILATSVGKPACFFVYGGVDEDVWDEAEKKGTVKELPANHSAFFAPVIEPTLRVAVDGYVGSALGFLGKQG